MANLRYLSETKKLRHSVILNLGFETTF